ncbi:MAG: IPT/TIG domain-containing protein, partial [Bryobacteraceae bacterium]
ITLNDPRIHYDPTFTRSVLTTVATDPTGISIVVDGKTIVAPQNFAWTAGGTHTVGVNAETQPAFSGAQRYVYQNWSDGGDTTHSVTAGPGPATFTAGFKRQFLVLTNVSPISGGTLKVDPVSADNFYDGGTELTLLPLAAGSAKFVNWSDDLGGADAPAKLIVDDEKIVTANFAAPKQLTPTSIVGAANFILNGGVAPGEIVTIFGLEFGPDSLTTSRINPATQNLETVLSDTRVFFDGISAPLIYVSPNQLSAVVPYSVAGKASTQVTVSYNNQTTNALLVPVIAAVPALFTFDSSGKGPAALLNQDGSTNTRENPASRGSTVVLYGTGEGQTLPAGVDGKPAGAPLPRPVLPVKVLIAGREAIVDYAGGAPGLTAGLLQVNVRIPEDAPAGAIPVSLVIGTKSSPANVTIWVR